MHNALVYSLKYEIGQFLKINYGKAILQYLVAYIPLWQDKLCLENVYLGLFFATVRFFAKYITICCNYY